MTLIELVKKYKGSARFDVNRVVNHDDEDVVSFLTEEVEAIKDSILNAEVVQFTVTGVSGGTPTVSVLVEEAKESAPGEGNEAAGTPEAGA